MPSVARLFLVILSAGLAAGVSTHTMSASVDISVDVKAAQQIAGLALDCVDREYPNQIQHAMAGDDDLGPPRRLTPAFYGCFDWHSSRSEERRVGKGCRCRLWARPDHGGASGGR